MVLDTDDTMRALNLEARNRQHTKADEQPLVLKAPVAVLAAQQGTQAINLELLDTPGPNEAGQEHLRLAQLACAHFQKQKTPACFSGLWLLLAFCQGACRL